MNIGNFRKIETMKKYEVKILEPKSTISKIKNLLAGLNRFEMTEVRRCEYIKRNYEI